MRGWFMTFCAFGAFFAGGTGRAAEDPRSSASRFGVLEFLHWDHDWNARHYANDKPERAVALMKEAGVGFIRMDFLWNDVEPREGTFAFEKYDRLVRLLDENGIKILGLLDYNTDWGGDNWNSAPDPARFARYARAVVARYKDKVKYWEIWNEPDQDIYWLPQDGMKAYTALLKKTYPEIKAEDPTAVVLLGGLSGTAAGPLRQVYKHGGKPFFDVVNVHPFVDPLDPAAMEKMKAVYDGVLDVMRAHGDGPKPVWITEIGCPGLADPLSTAPWWSGKNPDEAEQARWVDAVYRGTKGWPNLEKIFWAFFRDTPGHFASGTDAFGLLREDFSKKPAFEAYRAAAAGDQR